MLKTLTRTRINKIGKIGKANIKANKELKEVYEHKGTHSCELRLEGCLRNFALSFAHRHKRVWYRSDIKKLSSYEQTVVACQNCHDKIEYDKELTEKEFLRLRGEEL